jgi:transposase InsO family protein
MPRRRIRRLQGAVLPASLRAAVPALHRVATLECEWLERRRFASQAEAKTARFSFIEGWYHPVRLHSALGYRSPMACEAAKEAVATEP